MTTGGIRGTLRSAFLDNLSLKALSLGVALGLYAFIHGAENAQRTLSVSVVSVMPPDSANRQLMTQIPTEVAVRRSGHAPDRSAERQRDAPRSGSLDVPCPCGPHRRADLPADH
jgi:hypothetical protein